MTRFNIEQLTEQSETIYVEIDQRFNLAIERTEDGLEIRVYPRTEGELWTNHLRRSPSTNPRLSAWKPTY